MPEFVNILLDYSFLRNAVIIALLASIACGITGSFVVKKKMTFVSGGIAHAVMGGIGIAYYLYTYMVNHRFSNMGLLLFSTSVIIFMIGLVSEQITHIRHDETN